MVYNNQYERDLSTIKKIGKKQFGEELKNKTKDNMRGAIIGGGVGVILGLASRKNIYVFGIIGLIMGRILLSK